MMILKLLYILMPAAIIMSFFLAPPAAILGDYSRIIYFHVPIAWVSVLAFIVSGLASTLYLLDDRKRFIMLEEKAYNSAVIGIIFTVLTVIIGSMWAKLSWGSYWNWDPRERSIVILLLIYIAYFSLRTSLSQKKNSGRIASAYLIFAMLVMPFFVFIIPRIYGSLHPKTIINLERKIHLETTMRITLLTSTIAFTFLYFTIFNLMNRISLLNKRIEDTYE